MRGPPHFDPLFVLNSIYNGIVTIDAEGIIMYFNSKKKGIQPWAQYPFKTQ